MRPLHPLFQKFIAPLLLALLFASPLLATPQIQVRGESASSPVDAVIGIFALFDGSASYNNISNGTPGVSTENGTAFGFRDNMRDPLVRVGGSSAHRFKIRNRSHDSILTLGSISFTDPQFTALPALNGLTVGPRDDLDFQIVFSPTVSGPTSAVCTIASDDPATPFFTFSLLGDATGNLVLSGAPLVSSPKLEIINGDDTPQPSDGTDFGTNEIGMANPNTSYFSLFNPDNDPIEVESIVVFDLPGFTSDAQQFSISPADAGPSTIPPGGTRLFEIDYDPQSPGIHQTFGGVVVTGAPGVHTFMLQGMTPQVPDSAVYAGVGGVFRPASLIPDNNPTTSVETLTDFGELSVTPIPFGPYASTGEREHRFKLSNPGGAQLNIGAGFSSSNANFSVRVPNPTVTPGGSVFFYIKFDPTSVGTKIAAINIPTNDPDNPVYTINVRGVGIGPSLSVSGAQNSGSTYNPITSNQLPTSSNGTSYSTQVVNGTPNPNYFRLTNNGAVPLVISSISFGGSNPGDFYGISGSITVEPNASATIKLYFKPLGTGSRDTQIAFVTNDPITPTFFLRLDGTGQLGPVAALTGRRNSSGTYRTIPNGSLAVVSNNGTTFDPVTVGANTTNTFRITNNGDDDLKSLTFSSSLPDYTLVSAFPSVVTVGASQDFSIRFTPSTTGNRKATITINGLGSNLPYTFVVQRDSVSPRIVVTASAPNGNTVPIAPGDFFPSEADGTDFGECYIGESVTRKFNIENRGTQPLNVSNVRFLGGGGQFVFVNITASGGIINPEDSVSFNVDFVPTSSGIKTANVALTSNDSDIADYIFTVTGTAVARPIGTVTGRTGSNGTFATVIASSTTPTTTNGTLFPTVTPGLTSTNTFRLTNSGSSPLTVGKISSDSPNFDVLNFPANTVLAIGATRDFSIRYAPQDTAANSALISVLSNDPINPSYSFQVAGQASAPSMQVYHTGTNPAFFVENDFDYFGQSASGTNFGPIEPNVPETHTFEVRNTGTEILTVTFTGSSNTAFTVLGGLEDQTQQTINPDSALAFSVRYNSASVGTHEGVLSFSTNDPSADGGEYLMRLTGITTGSPQLSAFGEGRVPTTAFRVIPLAGPGGSTEDNGTVFPSTPFGQTETRRLKFTNSGVAPFNILAITSNNPAFSVDTNSGSLAPGAEIIANLEFSPETPGYDSGIIMISTDINGGTIYTFKAFGLSIGKGYYVRGGPSLQEQVRTYRSIGFGPREEDGTQFPALTPNVDTLTRTFEIVNTGYEPLTIEGIDIVGGNSGDFSVFSANSSGLFNNPTGTIAPGTSALFLIRYAPTAAGVRSSVVRIRSDAHATQNHQFAIGGGTGAYTPSPPTRVETLTGTILVVGGQPPAPEGPNIGAADVAATSVVSLRIFNPSNVAVQLDDAFIPQPYADRFFIGRIATVIPANGFVDIEIQSSDESPLGFQQIPVTLVTSASNNPVMTFNVGIDFVIPVPVIRNINPDSSDILLTVEIISPLTPLISPSPRLLEITSSSDLQQPWMLVPGKTQLSPGVIRIQNALLPNQDRFYRAELVNPSAQ